MNNNEDLNSSQEDIANDFQNKSYQTLKQGAKTTYKVGTSAGKKLARRGVFNKVKRGGITVLKNGGRAILNIGKFITHSIKVLLLTFLSWGWIFALIGIVVALLWIIIPALKQYTTDGANLDSTVADTNHGLSRENKSLHNYYTFYSDKAFYKNKIKIEYTDVDMKKTGLELFKELNDKKYILGPTKPNKITPPGNSGSGMSVGGTGSGSTGSSPNGGYVGTGAAKELIEEAKKHLGKSYSWGAKGPNSFDCSGFVYYCMNQIGVKMTYHNSSALRKALDYKEKSTLQPGDFVFYHRGTNTEASTVDHVAIYMGKIDGKDKIIHSSRPPGNVNITDLPTNSTKRVYTFGRWPGLSTQENVIENSLNNNSRNNLTNPSNPLESLNQSASRTVSNTEVIQKTKTATSSSNKKITVVVDAGHGGTDPGTNGNGMKEKDIVLNYALQLKIMLENAGFNVLMTRESDIDVAYSARYNMSNNYGDLFISIHSNGSGGPGIETFYPEGKDSTLSDHVQSAMIKETNAKNRGSKSEKETNLGSIAVLRENTKPAALVEIGFIGNKEEFNNLINSQYQTKLLTGIVNGIKNYLDKKPIENPTGGMPGGTGGTGGTGGLGDSLIDNVVSEMEGFIAEETIAQLKKYWEKTAKPTMSWTWNTEELKKELNEKINYGYEIKPYEEIAELNKKYITNEEDESVSKIVDKYRREEYFKIPAELLHVLNQNLYKDEFIHTESLIKPVKVNDYWELDTKAFNPNGKLSETEKLQYGLNTVFIYRPVITFKIQKGVSIQQEAVATGTGRLSRAVAGAPEGGSSSTTVYGSKPTGTIIQNIDCKVEYVLERAITFAGEYIFEYEQEINLVHEENVENITVQNGVKVGNLIQSKTYEVTEIPKDIIFQNKGRTYLENYLGNFITEIPEDCIVSFNKNRIYTAFENYEEGAYLADSSEEDSSNSGGETGEGGGGTASAEIWRSLCEEIAPKYGIDPNMVLSLIHCESTGNIHTGNSNYKGLLAMGSSNWQLYFKNESPWNTYTANDRLPNCSKKNCDLNDAEHQRVARFQIEYGSRRLSAQMRFYLNHHYKITEFNSSTVSQTQLQEAIYFTMAGYNSGEYGQCVIVGHYTPSVYAAPGTTYTEAYRNRTPISGHCIKSFTPINPKDNATYMEKNHKYFPLYSGGVALSEAATAYNYEPEKWVKHVSEKGSSGGNPGTENSGNSENALEDTGINKELYTEDIQQYELFELEGLGIRGYRRVSNHIDIGNIELLLTTATAMKYEIPLSEVDDSNLAFWDKTFVKKNFVNGFPKGKSRKDYRGKNVSSKEWKKVLDTVDFIESNIGESSIPNVIPFNTSNLIGHAYYMHGGLKLTRSASGISDDVELKVQDESEITLGDILILGDSGFDTDEPVVEKILFAKETAICIGDDSYAIIRGRSLVTYSMDMIKSSYELMEIVRPIESKRSINSSNSNISGTYPYTPGEWAWPTVGNIVSSDFGPRNTGIPGASTNHMGIDISTRTTNQGTLYDQPIYASKEGIVEFAGLSGSAGNYVLISHSDGTQSQYMHMKNGSIKVSVGAKVSQGQQIGIMGSTGVGNAIHLHFGIRTKDSNRFSDVQNKVHVSAVQLTKGWYYVDPELVVSKPDGYKVERNQYVLPYQK